MNRMKKMLVGGMCFTLYMSFPAFAVQLDGVQEITIPPSSSARAHSRLDAASSFLTVGMVKVKLSPKEISILQKNAKPSARPLLRMEKSDLPSRAELAMDKFPVLDQGRHGSCVMFANTAALNYLLDKPDHISQLCGLTLGSTLAKSANSSHHFSGWNGTWGSVVLEQFIRFGYVTKADQEQYGCAGLKAYPLHSTVENGRDTIEDYRVSLQDYHHLSHHLNSIDLFTKPAIEWRAIMNDFQRFDATPLHVFNGDYFVQQVKKIVSLKQNNNLRSAVTVGVLLYLGLCGPGTCAETVMPHDTWALTKKIQNKLVMGIPPNAAHELMLIGYDDDAVTVDTDGVTHKGLFKLRNSWGEEAGDHGDYYMTYDYFKWFVTEAHQIVRVED